MRKYSTGHLFQWMQVTVSSPRSQQLPDGHEISFLLELNKYIDTWRTDLHIKCGVWGWRPETTWDPKPFVVCILDMLLQTPGSWWRGARAHPAPAPAWPRVRARPWPPDHGGECWGFDSFEHCSNKHLSPSEQQHSAATLAAATSFHSNVPGPPHTGHVHMCGPITGPAIMRQPGAAHYHYRNSERN